VTPIHGVFAPERDGEVIDDRAHLPALDGLRGFAALFVVLLHLTMQIKHPHTIVAMVLKYTFIYGWTGVNLFFVLSGFLITGILDDAKGSTNYFRVFYARRMLRILPLYYGALAILFIMPHVVGTPGAQKFIVHFSRQIWYWVYLQNYRGLPLLFIGVAGHFWSLAIEEQFYLVWPLIIFLLSRKRALYLCAAILPLEILYRIVMGAVYPRLAGHTITLAALDGLAVGSALALLYRTHNGTRWIRKHLLAIGASSLAAIVAVEVLRSRPVARAVMETLLAIFYGCLLVYAIEARRGPAARFFRAKIMKFYGRYSYGLYVLHVPLIPIAYLVGVTPRTLAFGGSEVVGALLYVALMMSVSTAAAWISYNVYEKHFLRFKRHFAYTRPVEAVPHREPAVVGM
jgi:peptidoglycan/LPS O-acetylase OafA/YrhL